MHVCTYIQKQGGTNSSNSSVLLLLYVRVMLLAAAYCTDVPLCILLALHTQVQLAAVALTPVSYTHLTLPTIYSV